MAKKSIIVDGYNVLRSGSRYSHIQHPDYTDDFFNTARERLINDVAAYAAGAMQATVVFDGAGNQFSHGEVEKVGSVNVIFSPAGRPADYVIEKLAREARDAGREVLVVTSDSTIQTTVYSAGVDRMSAEGFCREIEMFYHEVTEDSKPEISQKHTIADRINPDILKRLQAMRDQ